MLGGGTLPRGFLHSALRCAPSPDRSTGPQHGHTATRSAALLTISTLTPAHRHPASPATGSSPPPATAAVQPTCGNTMAPAQRPSAACVALLRASGELQRLNWALQAPGKAARGPQSNAPPSTRPLPDAHAALSAPSRLGEDVSRWAARLCRRAARQGGPPPPPPPPLLRGAACCWHCSLPRPSRPASGFACILVGLPQFS